jgi:urea transport system ATP-binding protein
LAADGATPLLQVEGLNQYYGGSHILRNLGFEAKVGEITVILGRNGVGKTTLLKSLMGVVGVKTGSVKLDGADITKAASYDRVRKGIGYVPQGREIFGRLTVDENLRMGLATQPGGMAVPAQLFELFPILKQFLNRRGGDLSGGQQQQLAIARALAAGPKLLMLDEPTEGIQPSIIKDIGRVLRMLADTGMNGQKMAIVLVEQYYDFAEELADQYIVMERGEIVQRGSGANMQAEGVRARMSI